MTDKNKTVPFPHTHSQFNAQTARSSNMIGEKIRTARHRKGLSQSTLAGQLSKSGISVQAPAVAKWEKGENIPNAYQLIALCDVLDIRSGLDYFTGRATAEMPPLNARGMQKLEEYKEDLIASGKYSPKETAAVRMRLVRVSSLPASAGPGEFLDYELFEQEEFPEDIVPAGTDFAVRVNGDSMEPVFTEGQIVWIRQCECLSRGDIGLFIVDGHGYIKVYDEQLPPEDIREEYIDSSGMLHMQPVLISYNENYEPKVIAPSMDFHIAGRVLK